MDAMTTPILTDAAAAEIEQRANAATNGPWRPGRMDMLSYLGDGRAVHYLYRGDAETAETRVGFLECPGGSDPRFDAVFCGHARYDVPLLLADRRLLIAELAAVTAERDAAVAAHRELLDDCLTELDCNCKPWLQRKCTRCCVKAALTPPTTPEPRP